MAPVKHRICHVVGDSSFGGGSMIVLALAERAIAEGIQVSVVATDKEFGQRLAGIGAEVVPLDCIRRPINPLFDVRGAFALMRHFRRTDYDLVHTHTTKAGMIGRFAAHHAGVPRILHTVHGFAFHEASGVWSTRIIAGLERLSASWCHRIVCVSNYHRDWALKLRIASPGKIVAIPNGISRPSVSPDYDRTTCRKELGVGDDEFLVAGVGRLAEQKGFRYLVEAASVLKAQYRRCKYVLAGEGPCRADLEERIRKVGLDDRFKLLGYRARVGEIYAAADLVVQPSLWEGLSISLLEAMSMERPIITTDIGSNREVVGDSAAALLVPPADAGALVAAMSSLIDDPDRRAVAVISAESIYSAGYTEDRMLDSYMLHYRSLLNDRETADHG